MVDVEHMRRALALAATVRNDTAPNPWVGCVVVAPERTAATPAGHPTLLRGGDRAAGGARTPRWWPWPRPLRPRAGRHVVRDPRAVRPPRPHAALHRRHHCGRCRPRRRRSRRPGPTGRRPWHRGAADSGDRGGGGCRGHGGRRAAGAVPQAPDDRDGPGWCSRWRPAWTPGLRRRTGRAAGSPGPPPAATSTGCAPARTRCSSGPARCGPTIPS